MAKTAVADIIIPTEFEKYALERMAELLAFGRCGIVEHAPEFDALAAAIHALGQRRFLWPTKRSSAEMNRVSTC